MVEHFYVKFGYPSCISFLTYRAEKQTDRQTDKQTPLKVLPRDYRRRG